MFCFFLLNESCKLEVVSVPLKEFLFSLLLLFILKEHSFNIAYRRD